MTALHHETGAAPVEPLPLAEVDLADNDRFLDGETPWRMFETLRREDSVHWQREEAPNSGFWAVTRHADIVTVDRDPETFTSSRFVNLEEVDDSQIAIRQVDAGARRPAPQRPAPSCCSASSPRARSPPTASSCAS